MKRWPFFIAMCLTGAGFSGGCSKQAPAPTAPKAAHVFSLEAIDQPIIFNTAADAAAVCEQNIAHVERLRALIKAVQGKHTQENTLEPFNEMDIAFERIMGVSELMANTHPSEDVRTAAEQCTERAAAVQTEVQMDPELYAAISDVDTASLDTKTKRYVAKTLQSYKLSGVDKDEASRAKLAEIDKAIVKAGQDFDRNIRNDKKTLLVKPEDLDGLAEDFIKSHEVSSDGMITLTTDYTDLFPVLKYAKNEKIREEMQKLSASRAYPVNEQVFKDLLNLRSQYAQIIGYPNWAAYNASDKMAKDTKTIENFLEDIAAITKPRSDQEVQEFMTLKKGENPEAAGYYPWDRFYYTEMLKRQKYDFDAQSAKQYFPYERVKRGILSVASQIYGLTFQHSDRPVWDDSVEAYDVYQGNELIARFYLDMHPRDGKYGHAASFGMLSGVEGLQLPAGTLVCNFPEPTPSNPALMEHSDVVTFFHEFGHLLHQLLSGRHHWVRQSGISCEWDFVEAPSQLFEDWAWDYDVLKMFAVNDKGEVIPKELVDRMKKSEDVGKGVSNMRQISYAKLSYTYHSTSTDTMNILDVQKDVFSKYSPFTPYDGDYTFASFGHLNGYSSMYYTYMWSLAIAKDLAGEFNKNGHLDLETAHKYRDSILAVGGALDAKDMVHNFLGRDYNLDAFKQWLSE